MTVPGSHVDYPLTLLERLADRPARERILRAAATELRQSSDDESRDLVRRALLGHVQGFRDPLFAPAPLLARELDQFLFANVSSTRDLLRLWIQAAEPLADAINSFLEAFRDDERLKRLITNSPESWSDDDLLSLAETFITSNKDYHQADIAIALADHLWQHRIAPAIPSNEHRINEAEPPRGEDEVLLDIEHTLAESDRALASSRFAQWLQEVRALPVDAVDWDDLALFIAQLIREKAALHGRLEQRCQEVQNRLRGLRIRFADPLAYLERPTEFLQNVVIQPAQFAKAAALSDALEQQLEKLAHALSNRPSLRSREAEWRLVTDTFVADVERLLIEAEAIASPSSTQPGGIHAKSPTTSAEAPTTPTETATEPGRREGPPSAPSVDSSPSASPVNTPMPEVKPTTAGTPTVDVARAVEGTGVSISTAAEASASARSTPRVTATTEAVPSRQLVWQLLADNDLAGAYWLTRSLMSLGIDADVNDDLIACALGSEFLPIGGTDLVLELARLTLATPKTEADVLLAHAAALRGVLVDPSPGFARWLAIPAIVRPLQDVVDQIRQFGGPLHPETLVDLSTATKRDAAIRERADDVREWLERAERRSLKVARATEVWRRLVRQDFTDAVRPIVQDQRGRLSILRAVLEKLMDRRVVMDRMRELDAELAGPVKMSLTGHPRDQIIHGAADLAKRGLRWCEIVEAASNSGVQRHSAQQALALRDRLSRLLPPAEMGLSGVAVAHPDRPEAATASVMLRTLASIRQMLNLQVPPRQERAFDNSLLWRLGGARSLAAALGSRLLWLPEVKFVAEDDGPPDDALPGIARALEQSLKEARSLATAFQGWVHRRDFRFSDILASALVDENRPGVPHSLTDEMESARIALSAALLETQTSIEQAAVDELISPDERAEYSAAAAIDVNGVLDFAARLETLSVIRRNIEQRRETRVNEQRAEFERLDRQLSASPQHAQAWSERRSFVSGLLERGDVRLAEECFRGMRDADEAGVALPEWTATILPAEHTLETFLGSFAALSGLSGMPGAGEWPTKLEPFRVALVGREEDAKGLWTAWTTVKRLASEADLKRGLENLFFRIGFQISNEVDRVTARVVDDYVEARVKMSPRTPPPAPQFGSYANGVFEVLCVWPKPGTDVLRTRLQEKVRQQHALFVLYFGALSALERRQATRPLMGRPVLILDEPLILFLALTGGGVNSLFACTLPYARLNPYTTAGRVPPELFHGREQLLERLEDVGGSCLIFGGRQLGKSALLNHVAHRLENQAEHSYTAVEDIQNVGSALTAQPASAVWNVLRSALHSMPPFANRGLNNTPEDLMRQVRQAFERDPRAKITIGLDEADNFLAADSARDFVEVTRLRSLMSQTHRRFRIILAGARTVQKYQGIPNQPLAHFGPALQVGPLESGAALRLVLEPLTAAGVRFGDDSLPLHILAFTNYHPALIQFVCSELLASPPATADPPYRITRLELQRVFRQVEERVRERFEWTLALDLRYQCIALTLIADQGRRSQSFGRAYSAREILDMVLGYWPEGFRDTAHNDLRATLDEMVGLGVLLRTPDGRYRLRSPNVVRLLGSIDDVEHRLLEFAGRPPVQTQQDILDRQRPMLRTKSGECGALTQAQERLLITPRLGVGLIFGSPALGLTALSDSIHRAFIGGGPIDGEDAVARRNLTLLPSAIVTGEELGRWLVQHVREHPPTKGDVIMQVVADGGDSFNDRVEAAIDVVRKPGLLKPRHWMRLVFVLGPAATWRWQHLATDLRDRLDRGLDFAFALDRWDGSALRLRLESGDLIAPPAACDALLRLTGSWPLLVEDVVRRCWPRGELRAAVTAVERELSSPDNRLRMEFLAGLGIDVDPGVRGLVELLRQERSIGADDTELADFVEPALSASEFSAAIAYLVQLYVAVQDKGLLSLDPVVARFLGRP